MSSLLLRGPTASAINHYDLILASETIYSPTTTPLFTRVVLDVLRPDGKGRALVAAKEIYFGVGGGVMDFMKGVNEGGGARENKEGRKWKWTAKVVKEVRDAGVARGVVEVRGEGEGAVG